MINGRSTIPDFREMFRLRSYHLCARNARRELSVVLKNPPKHRVENIFNKERKTSSKTERKICNNTTDNQQEVQNRCRLDLQSGAVRSLVQEKLCILVTHRSHYHHQVAL